MQTQFISLFVNFFEENPYGKFIQFYIDKQRKVCNNFFVNENWQQKISIANERPQRLPVVFHFATWRSSFYSAEPLTDDVCNDTSENG